MLLTVITPSLMVFLFLITMPIIGFFKNFFGMIACRLVTYLDVPCQVCFSGVQWHHLNDDHRNYCLRGSKLYETILDKIHNIHAHTNTITLCKNVPGRQRYSLGMQR